MKTSVSTYSFGSYVDSLGIYGVIDKTAEFGFDGIEFVEAGWSNASLDELKKIGEYAASKGLALASFCVGADFVNGSGGDTKAEVERIKGMVDKAAALGVKNMRHDVASQPHGKINISYDDCLPTISAAILSLIHI